MRLSRVSTTPGAYSPHFVGWKQPKLNRGLIRAIRWLFEPGWSVIDLGAGNGQYVSILRERGWPETRGVDGTTDIDKLTGGLVQFADLTSPLHGAFLERSADAAMCIEVGEHIPPELAGRFLDTVAGAARKMLVVSWATPGQRGKGHVNCRPPEWVARQFMRRGWQFDPRTYRARQIARRGMAWKLLVFTRSDSSRS